MSKELEHIGPIVKELREAIISAQYKAARKVNKEMLKLYFLVGGRLSQETQKANWGDKVLDKISLQLNQSISGLKGFSAQNLKKMRLFYEIYAQKPQMGSPVATQLAESNASEMGSPAVNQLQAHFWDIGFTHHFLIISKTDTDEERAFYIRESAQQGWSKRVLENHLNNKLFQQQGSLPTNFEKTLTLTPEKAIQQFRDEYLLDFISLDEADDERLVERRIVDNITQFILNLGKGFSFMGNQYRLEVEGKEFFIDLLFYNRELQAMVAFELKRGEFKPQYAGQLNFYLSGLDKQVKLPHENNSLGIILCKEKNNVIVEYALHGLDKPMGVATFKTREEIPEKYRKILPDTDALQALIGEEES